MTWKANRKSHIVLRFSLTRIIAEVIRERTDWVMKVTPSCPPAVRSGGGPKIIHGVETYLLQKLQNQKPSLSLLSVKWSFGSAAEPEIVISSCSSFYCVSYSFPFRLIVRIYGHQKRRRQETWIRPGNTCVRCRRGKLHLFIDYHSFSDRNLFALSLFAAQSLNGLHSIWSKLCSHVHFLIFKLIDQYWNT